MAWPCLMAGLIAAEDRSSENLLRHFVHESIFTLRRSQHSSVLPSEIKTKTTLPTRNTLGRHLLPNRAHNDDIRRQAHTFYIYAFFSFFSSFPSACNRPAALVLASLSKISESLHDANTNCDRTRGESTFRSGNIGRPLF